MLDIMLNTSLTPSPAKVCHQMLRPTAALIAANAFEPVVSSDAETLVRDAPRNAELRRPAPAPSPTAALYGLD